MKIPSLPADWAGFLHALYALPAAGQVEAFYVKILGRLVEAYFAEHSALSNSALGGWLYLGGWLEFCIRTLGRFDIRAFFAGFAEGRAVVSHENKLAVFALFHPEVGLAAMIRAGATVSLFELWSIFRMEAEVAGHEIEWVLAVNALPRHTLVPPFRRIALGLVAVIAYHIAPIESAFARTYRPHTIFGIAEHCGAFEAEEVVELLVALLALVVGEGLVGELVAEYEELCFAAGAFDVRDGRSLQFGLALGVDADDL